jgi:hypothetical protein
MTSNPTTNYITYNQTTGTYQDLSGIFQPLSLGLPIGYDTSFNVINYGDLSNIFASLSSGSNIGFNTGFQVNGNDLSTIFAAYNTDNSINVSGATTTSQSSGGILYTILFLSSGSSATFSQATNSSVDINYILIGSGAGGGAGNGTTGGGGSGGGGGGGGGFLAGSFPTLNGLTYTVQSAAAGTGGTRGSGNNGSNGNSSYIYSSASSSNYLYAFGGLNKNVSTGYSNGGDEGNFLNGGYGGGYAGNMSNNNSNVAGMYPHTPGSSDYSNATTGGAGGCGSDGNGNGGGSNYSLPTANSPTTSYGNLGSGYTMSYLGNIVYVSGGGSGCYNNEYQNAGGTGNPPGANPCGGNGGSYGNGGDGASYGGGGGGGSWGGDTGGGGNGGSGCAILWWETYS